MLAPRHIIAMIKINGIAHIVVTPSRIESCSARHQTPHQSPPIAPPTKTRIATALAKDPARHLHPQKRAQKGLGDERSNLSHAALHSCNEPPISNLTGSSTNLSLRAFGDECFVIDPASGLSLISKVVRANRALADDTGFDSESLTSYRGTVT